MTEDEMVGWHDLLNGHEFEQAPGYMWVLWVEMCPPRFILCSPNPSVPQNVTLFGDKVFTEVIKFK